jgi:UDP-MurNAc hydroxylase
MRVTFLGHAGLYIETRYASILCDPWLGGPAYYGSWWPFPDNDCVDPAALSRPTYLYISHLHHDHFYPPFLRRHVARDTVVLLPDYPLSSLEAELRRLGFHRFLRTTSWEPVEVDGLRLTIPTTVTPADGPIGDSGLVVEEGPVTLFNQNDSRPVDGLDRLGHVDLHFLQFSGAIGYPFLQGYPEPMRLALGRKKRAIGMDRARRYVEMVGADRFFPSSGPPCFLDPRLSWLNDLGDDAGNVFPDQAAFLDAMRRHGHGQGELVLPGSVAHVTAGRTRVRHPMSAQRIAELFSPAGKRAYLDDYRRRKQPLVDEANESLPGARTGLVRELRDWWEPLLAAADVLCAGVNGRLGMDFEDGPDGGLVVDFHQRTVRPWWADEGAGEVTHHFRFPRRLVEDCVRERREDWSTDLLLSFRFQERTRGPYNKYLFAFLSALSEERLRYVEDFYRRELAADGYAGQPFFRTTLGEREYVVQQRCPHSSADLSRFLEFDPDTDTLSCTLHGWRWRRDGTCLTAEGHPLYVQPADELQAAIEAGEPSGAAVSRQCAECTYRLARASRTAPR